ncbi:unnamed protein product [Urochloa decumbens]|uniref:Uncharacterized protein n=1 Tax=Urochloa decumbens TaxID=240449 RepID=A0ABC9BQ38_9POAL
MPITKEDDWLFYKELVKGSQVRCGEVFVDVSRRGVDIASLGVDGDDDPIEHVTQEDIPTCNEDDDEEDDELSDDDVEVKDEEASGDEGDLDTCRVVNNFAGDTFENEEQDDDDMSESSDEELCENDVERVEETVREPLSNVEPNPAVGTEAVVEEMVEETPREDMSTLSGFRLQPLTPGELRQLEAVHVQVPEVPIFHSIPSKAYCDSGLCLGSIEADSTEEFITKGMIFDSMDELKFLVKLNFKEQNFTA